MHTRLGESALLNPNDPNASDVGFDRIPGREPRPDLEVQVAEEFERLLDLLGEETLRRIAVFKMEGYTTKQIAANLNCAVRTVERKLERIRCIWKKSAPKE